MMYADKVRPSRILSYNVGAEQLMHISGIVDLSDEVPVAEVPSHLGWVPSRA